MSPHPVPKVSVTKMPELGKELAKALEPVVAGEVGTDGKDGSTARLVQTIRRMSGS